MNGKKLSASGVEGAQQEQQQQQQDNVGVGPRTNGNGHVNGAGEAGKSQALEQEGPVLERKLTNEKRVRESSEVSSSSGECESEESRAAGDDMYGDIDNKGQSNDDVAGSKEQQQNGDKEGATPGDSERTKDGGDKANQFGNAAVGGKPKLPRPSGTIECPRCNSKETKFCYYNNYNIKQPRYFCKSCQRYWTSGGTLRNVPVGAGRRKHKSSSKSDKNKSEGGIVVNPTAGQFSPYGNKTNNTDIALTYAAVAALKPQSMVISYTNQSQANLVSPGEVGAMGDQNQSGGPIQDSGGTNKQRNKSRSKKKKKQFVLDNHLNSKSLGSNLDTNGNAQDQSRALQAMLQLNSAQHQAAPQALPNFTNQQQAYQQLLSQNWVQLWQQMYLQSGWNQNPAAQSVFGIKREGGWPNQPNQQGVPSPTANAGSRQTTPQAAAPPQQPQQLQQPQHDNGNNDSNGNANGQRQQQQGSGVVDQQQSPAGVTTTSASTGRDGQIPWWYAQMVNNFAASQNPAAMMRSYNLQAAQVQENQEDNQT